MRIEKFIFGALVVAALAGVARAEDIFVNGSNLAGGDGSSANPFQPLVARVESVSSTCGLPRAPQ